MVAFSAIKAGDTLYQIKRQKMGNTTMTREAVYAVHVHEVHDGYAMASWNGNPPSRWSARQFEPLRRTRPTPKPDIFERARMARAERDAQGTEARRAETA